MAVTSPSSGLRPYFGKSSEMAQKGTVLRGRWCNVDGDWGWVEPSGAVSGEAAPATKHSEYHNTQMFPFQLSITFNRLHIKEFEMPQNTPRITHMFPVDPSVSSFHNFSRISISRHILEILTCKINTPYFTTLTYYQVCSMSRILTLLAMPRDFHSVYDM